MTDFRIVGQQHQNQTLISFDLTYTSWSHTNSDLTHTSDRYDTHVRVSLRHVILFFLFLHIQRVSFPKHAIIISLNIGV